MNLKDCNVYLSGPMTDMPHNNVSEFARAHAVVRELDARSVYNPALAWLNTPIEEDAKTSHEEWMRRSISELTRERLGGGSYYDVLVSLDWWGLSEGAVHERAVAERCGIVCVDLSDIDLEDEGKRQ